MRPGDVLAKAQALEAICKRLSAGDRSGAAALAHSEYPFVPPDHAGRRYGFYELVTVLFRDGFHDRYTGEPLVVPPVLRLLSAELPEALPYQQNWKMSCTHPMYWDFAPTIDHVVPVSRGGADDVSNWVAVSMRTNARKANWSLDELGWILRPPTDPEQWDGMTSWFLEYSGRPEISLSATLRTARRLLERAPRERRPFSAIDAESIDS
jgi:hypothetical protein